eukprot:SAG31_NODE_6261_length_2098_cov_1.548274_4_plen_83_part_00
MIFSATKLSLSALFGSDSKMNPEDLLVCSTLSDMCQSSSPTLGSIAAHAVVPRHIFCKRSRCAYGHRRRSLVDARPGCPLRR